MCCKLVDSFSVEQRMLTALTIFPDFSAAKATYVAIIDSLGRTIDRFCGANCTVFSDQNTFALTKASFNSHTGGGLWHCVQPQHRIVMVLDKLRVVLMKGIGVKSVCLRVVML